MSFPRAKQTRKNWNKNLKITEFIGYMNRNLKIAPDPNHQRTRNQKTLSPEIIGRNTCYKGQEPLCAPLQFLGRQRWWCLSTYRSPKASASSQEWWIDDSATWARTADCTFPPTSAIFQRKLTETTCGRITREKYGKTGTAEIRTVVFCPAGLFLNGLENGNRCQKTRSVEQGREMPQDWNKNRGEVCFFLNDHSLSIHS